MWGSYILAEGLLSVGGMIAFYIWQMRSLKRDVAEREARERAEMTQETPKS